jgi:hypothetical protein
LGNEELHNLYPSQNLIREVKTGRTERWDVHTEFP